MQTHHKYLSFAAIMIPLSGQTQSLSTANLMPKLLSSFSLFVRQKEEETKKMTRVTFCCEHAPYLHSISTSTGLVTGSCSWPTQQLRRRAFIVDNHWWTNGWTVGAITARVGAAAATAQSSSYQYNSSTTSSSAMQIGLLRD